jgi:hypothetical protein
MNENLIMSSSDVDDYPWKLEILKAKSLKRLFRLKWFPLWAIF